MKYPKKVILDYLSGNDLDPYDLDTLESDYEFMLDVLEVSKDPNMFFFCSLDLQYNYSFCYEVIQIFHMNIAFIQKVGKQFLEYNSKSNEAMDLIILVNSYMRKTRDFEDNQTFLEFQCMIEAFYSYEAVQALQLSKKLLNNCGKDLGVGFYFMKDKYQQYPNIMNYFAKHFVNEIFFGENSSFKEHLFNTTEFFQKIEKKGIHNWLIDYLSGFDSYLANYVRCHIILLTEVKKQMEYYQRNWNTLKTLRKQQKYEFMFEQVHSYMEEHRMECFFTEMEVLYFVGRELNELENIQLYDGIDSDMVERVLNSTFIDPKEMSLTNLKHYRNVKKIMENTLNKNGVVEENAEIPVVKPLKNSADIISFALRKKKQINYSSIH